MPAPTAEFFDRLNRAFQAPVLMALTPEESAALLDRLVQHATVDDVAPADRELLDQAEQEIRRGLSPTLQDPSNWGGDWAAEDEAADPPVEGKTLGQDGDDMWVGLGG